MVERRKLHEHVLGEVLAAIVTGEYPEGGRLPKETDLAEAHGVSRYVARESIQALRDRGVLTVKHGVGAVVAPRADWNLFDRTLLDAMTAGPERRRVVAEAAECRAIVWPEVAAAAATRRADADLEGLEQALGDPRLFRERLLQAARNRFLQQVLASLDGLAPETKSGARRKLRRVLDAIAAGDPEASREAMRAALARR